MPQTASELGEVIVYGRRITFPFGAPAGGGGDGPPLGDADAIEPIEPPFESLCSDISFLSGSDKEKYLIRYLSQKIADLIKNHPVQNREWGSAIWQDANGNFHFTSFIPTTTPQAQINWNDLPQINGQPDWSRVRGFIHSHPQLNLPIDPTTGNEENYYDTNDPSYLLRPWDGDWQTFRHLRSNIGPGPNADGLALFIVGYTEDASGVGRWSLHGYDASHDPGTGSTPTATPEITGLQPPCNE